MKALHTYTTIARWPKAVRRIDTLDVEKKVKQKKTVKNVKNTIQAGQVKRHTAQPRNVRRRDRCQVQHPTITGRRNNALNSTALRPSLIPSVCSAQLRNKPWPVLLCTFRDARLEQYVRHVALSPSYSSHSMIWSSR